ncbi:hypothetical protein F5884DRAFT_771642 [Xylogone sp. PMI_703]|nr:hypothetical protein F5884DRAFT_771642 [Xylogone sp. PMI_703]
MTSKTVSTLKFVGSISLGLLTGLSYTLSTLTVPTLLTLPSATSASKAFSNLASVSLTQARTLASISGTSFVLAYLLSPRAQKHPYLLWSALFVAGSSFTDYVFPSRSISEPKQHHSRDTKGKARQMDASYEVVGGYHSEGTASGEENEEDVNGEEVREALKGFMTSQIARTTLAGIGFAMSVIGLWGDGASDVVIIRM